MIPDARNCCFGVQDLHKYDTEPYHIVRTGSPLFSAEFCGWGRDKVARLDDLFMAGYSLHVLPEVRCRSPSW